MLCRRFTLRIIYPPVLHCTQNKSEVQSQTPDSACKFAASAGLPVKDDSARSEARKPGLEHHRRGASSIAIVQPQRPHDYLPVRMHWRSGRSCRPDCRNDTTSRLTSAVSIVLMYPSTATA